MKSSEFKEFTKLLQKDIDTAECMGFAFLNCTERQICNIVDIYIAMNLVETIETRRGLEIQFGKNVKMSYPVKDYSKYCKGSKQC